LQARVIRLDEDEVLVRQEVGEHPDHFDVEPLGLRPREHRQAVALVARLELLDIEQGWGGGSRFGGHGAGERRGEGGSGADEGEGEGLNPGHGG
jgi:hypothetical protein